jgi:hypothetical protein
MTYEELCDDERWKVLMKRCENLPISKVSALKIEDMWPEMPDYLRESFEANYDPDDICYFESIADVIDNFFLYEEESITKEQHDEVLNWASKLKDIELIHFVER